MGFIANVFRAKVAPGWSPVPPFLVGKAQIAGNNYMGFAREGYMGNELVFACIEELSTSGAEPGMLVKSGGEWVEEHKLLDLMNRPNPLMDRFAFWATVIMHRSLAGNAYALKVRSRAGRVVQLWLLRPDRMRIIPGGFGVSHYQYVVGTETVPLPVEDVIHMKTRHPLDDFYGMPPLMPISGRVDIDNYMRDFVKAYFQNAGVPAGILTTKAKLSEAQRTEIRERMRGQFGGPAGWHETMVLDNADATFTPLTSNLGQRGLVIPELDEISEARIPAVFGVPESLIGTRTSYQNGGYANKRAEEQHFWTGTLIPMYRELVGPLNLNLVPDFAGAEEIKFDLRDVGALQEDVTAVAHRARDMVDSGLWTVEEGRVATGMPAKLTPGETLLIPSNLTQVPVEDLGVTPEPLALPAPKPMEEAMA